MTSQNPSAQSRVGALARPWLFPFLVSVSHVGGLTAQPQEYERVVVEFFDRHLIDGEPLS